VARRCWSGDAGVAVCVDDEGTEGMGSVDAGEVDDLAEEG
jgi:hypothetical protein